MKASFVLIRVHQQRICSMSQQQLRYIRPPAPAVIGLLFLYAWSASESPMMYTTHMTSMLECRYMRQLKFLALPPHSSTGLLLFVPAMHTPSKILRSCSEALMYDQSGGAQLSFPAVGFTVLRTGRRINSCPFRTRKSMHI